MDENRFVVPVMEGILFLYPHVPSISTSVRNSRVISRMPSDSPTPSVKNRTRLVYSSRKLASTR